VRRCSTNIWRTCKRPGRCADKPQRCALTACLRESTARRGLAHYHADADTANTVRTKHLQADEI
jgi:hypothetical protein